MNRTLIYVLLTLFLAAWLGRLVVRDPGYVMISYDGTTVQTGLWVFLGVVVVTLGLLFLVVRLLRSALAGVGDLNARRIARQQAKASGQTIKGLVNLAEGNWVRAERYLAAAAGDSSLPAINLLAAAKAANEQGRREERDAYFRRAAEENEEITAAGSLLQAEMMVANGEYEEAADVLSEVAHGPRSLDLLKRIYVETGAWAKLAAMIPDLPGDDAPLVLSVHEARFSELADLKKTLAPSDGLARTAEAWRKVSKPHRRDPGVLAAYCRCLVGYGGAPQAAKALVKRLGSGWNQRLAVLYLELTAEDRAEQIKALKKLEKKHVNEPGLHLCLAGAYQAAWQPDEARKHLEFCLTHQSEYAQDAYVALGNIYAAEGNYAESNDCYRRALGSVSPSGAG